ncbi:MULTISPECIES: TetR/AcrR family transcriptional regulator [Solirubrobacterales]|uniref:TetR/AcrR family transcriptional regulator n=1 Tax=Solirubrobacterales TaxID=588673 RepID=UPI001304FBF2|nr:MULTISPECIES: TetR/AcrR family transcriptional regulator [Solirubrobacterales]
MALLEKRTREDPRRGETERAFLAATEALLAEGASFADLNVSRIAKRAGRTRTAFYAHFEDRRDLLVRLVEDFATEIHGVTSAHWDQPLALADVRRVVADLLGTFRAHAPLVRALVEASGYDPEIRAYWSGTIERFVGLAEERLRRDGRPPAAATATAQALVWMTERTAYQQVVAEDPAVADRTLIAALAEIWERTLNG